MAAPLNTLRLPRGPGGLLSSPDLQLSCQRGLRGGRNHEAKKASDFGTVYSRNRNCRGKNQQRRVREGLLSSRSQNRPKRASSLVNKIKFSRFESDWRTRGSGSVFFAPVLENREGFSEGASRAVRSAVGNHGPLSNKLELH